MGRHGRDQAGSERRGEDWRRIDGGPPGAAGLACLAGLSSLGLGGAAGWTMGRISVRRGGGAGGWEGVGD